MKEKLYLLRETKTIGEYQDKKEAMADKDNNEMWYPENNYEVIEQEIEIKEVRINEKKV